jgi:hypothetical protein
VTTGDENLLGDIARGNWIILCCLVLASLFWRSAAIFAGVLCGGLLAIIAYLWLYRSLRRILAEPSHLSARRFQINYFFRLGFLAAVLFALITLVKVNPIALAVGLSTVVINIFLTTLKRAFSTRRQ